MKAKKLIEVALPIKEISAESVRDKSIRHGHISTLHLWWARRPLPVCRAIVFASLVPDPLDKIVLRHSRMLFKISLILRMIKLLNSNISHTQIFRIQLFSIQWRITCATVF